MENGKLFYDYAIENDDFLISGHEDIFIYNIKAMNPTDTEYLVVNGDIENSLCIIGVLVYHKNLCSIVIAAKKEFLQGIEQKKK